MSYQIKYRIGDTVCLKNYVSLKDKDNCRKSPLIVNNYIISGCIISERVYYLVENETRVQNSIFNFVPHNEDRLFSSRQILIEKTNKNFVRSEKYRPGGLRNRNRNINILNGEEI